MFDTPETPRLLAFSTVLDRTSLSEATARRMMERDEFPKPVRLSRNRIAWREPDVNDWINSRPMAA